MSFKEWSDLLSNLAEILIAVIGFIVFWQLNQAQKDLKIRSKRDAGSISVQLAEVYRKEIIPMINKFYDLSHNCGFGIVNVNFENLKIDDFFDEDIDTLSQEFKNINQISLDVYRKHQEIRDLDIEILNALESFAINITKGIADEAVIFEGLAQTYCNFVARSFPFLCKIRKRGQFNLYQNVVELYKEWSKKIKLTGLSNKENGIREEFNKINTGSRLKPPIGTR